MEDPFGFLWVGFTDLFWIALKFATGSDLCGPSAGATDSLTGKTTRGSDWQCVQLWFVGRVVGLYGTGGGRRPAQTKAV